MIIRHGIQADAISLAHLGGKVSPDFSKSIVKKIRENSDFREKLEAADKMAGKTTLALELAKNVTMTEEKADNLMKNEVFGGKINAKIIS